MEILIIIAFILLAISVPYLLVSLERKYVLEAVGCVGFAVILLLGVTLTYMQKSTPLTASQVNEQLFQHPNAACIVSRLEGQVNRGEIKAISQWAIEWADEVCEKALGEREKKQRLLDLLEPVKPVKQGEGGGDEE